ncbi:TetR/AcrR family transcriptional regulator [Saccharopolyspora sp. TS4A08]|uniref:TetR/AcrR family transcriptional regulator n=1 Tax=Saccharopolyspora ipomoeae TaxID=3042027 RepID=A0ABT6PQV3_9PSEU|nr:TetR/AcrR family transcriptional regulator [Saccharopolyspora sp. TS4A08]MDI2030343.1 TetR/AcrR family transcriptional regulator [Saccharopolyspora sp. TS4A08]
MTTPRAAPQADGRRKRTEMKRAAILDAAEELFVSDGFEVTSVDAIAARAGVSKRTVYDHFGDKRGLFVGVLERSGEVLLRTIRAAIDEELTEGRDLREALHAFAQRVTTETFPSSVYVNFRRLNGQNPPAPRLPDGLHDEPERSLEERFTRYADAGALRLRDPRRAVQHFIALTMRLALDVLDQTPDLARDTDELHDLIADGVDAFLRAYT